MENIGNIPSEGMKELNGRTVFYVDVGDATIENIEKIVRETFSEYIMKKD